MNQDNTNEPKQRGPLTARQLVAILAGFLVFLAAAASVGYVYVQDQNKRERVEQWNECVTARMLVASGTRTHIPASCDS